MQSCGAGNKAVNRLEINPRTGLSTKLYKLGEDHGNFGMKDPKMRYWRPHWGDDNAF